MGKLRTSRLVRADLVPVWKAVESASDAIAIGDMEGNTLYHNPAYVALYGYSVEELREAGGPSILYQDQRVIHAIMAAFEAGNAWQGEAWMQTRGGAKVLVSMHADLIKDSYGTVLGTIGLSRDITRDREQQYRLRLIERAVSSAAESIIVTDAQAQIEYVNPAFERLFGHSLSEIKGTPVPATIFEDRSQMALIEEVIRSGRDWSGETRIQRVAGSPFPAYIHVGRIIGNSHQILGLVATIRDMTEYRAAVDDAFHQREMAEGLAAVASALNSTLDLDEILDLILSEAQRVVSYDAASIILLEDGQLRMVRSRGYHDRGGSPAQYGEPFAVPGASDFRQVLESGAPRIIADLSLDPVDHILAGAWVSSRALLALRADDEVLGLMIFDSDTPGFYLPGGLRWMHALADQAALAIRNARLYRQAQEFAALEERQRIARELHDVVRQTLFSASLMAENLPRLFDQDPEAVRQHLNDLVHMTRSAAAEMGTLLVELRPSTLAEAELGDLLRSLVESVKGRRKMTYHVDVEKIQLPPDVQMAFYRIAQEALNNMLRHARATELSLILHQQDDQVLMRIQDNGRGFDMSQLGPEQMGLSIMHERAESIRGELHISSLPGEGCQIELRWNTTTPRGKSQWVTVRTSGFSS